LVGLVSILSLRQGHDWGDDFAHYILLARNVAQGIHYTDNGYIYNPSSWRYAPKAYSPVFPLLLAPVYRIFGLNLIAMKIEVILFFLLFLIVYAAVFRNQLPFRYLFFAIIVLGMNPYFCKFKNQILSDIPFLFFCYLSFLAIIRLDRHKQRDLYAVLAGLAMYLAYGTKPFGALILPCFIFCELLSEKKLSKRVVVVSATFFSLAWAQAILWPSGQAHPQMFIFNYKITRANAAYYWKCITEFWSSSPDIFFTNLLTGSSIALALVGFFSSIRAHRGPFAVFRLFFVAYLSYVMILYYGRQGPRYLFPAIPLYVFYVFYGIRRIETLSKKTGLLVFAVFMTATACSYVYSYRTMTFGSITWGPTGKEAVNMFEFIKKNTKAEDVVITGKPRVLALFTGRQAAVYHHPKRFDTLWYYFRQIDATYLIVGIPFGEKTGFLKRFVQKYRSRFSKVYYNSKFEIFRIVYPETSGSK